jgi:hypothetical protein
MAGGPEDHFTDSRELYVLVEGDERMGACGGPRSRRRLLDPPVCATRQLADAGEKAVIEPSSLQRRNSPSSSRKSRG